MEGPSRGVSDLPRPDDVWIVSYPKTGSTWLRHLVTNLYRAKTSERGTPATFAEVDLFIPFLEDKTAWTSRNMFREMPAPRVFKAHEPWSCDTFPCTNVVGAQARTQCMCPQCAHYFKRVIYVYRSGIETLASYYRFRLGLRHIKEGFSFGRFANQRRMYPGTSWGDHVRSWKYAQETKQAEVLWVSYENLTRDPESQMKRIAKFLGVSASLEDLQFAIDASSKKTMKKMEEEQHGLSFFKKRYKNVENLKFVDSTTSDHLKTPYMWSNNADPREKKEWAVHNQHVMDCLGYNNDHVPGRSNAPAGNLISNAVQPAVSPPFHSEGRGKGKHAGQG